MNKQQELGDYGCFELCSGDSLFTEIMLKILVIGDYGVGKTAVVRRYTEGKFSSNYKITIGAEFSIKTIHWDSFTRVNIQLWDIAGHERFGYMTRVFYKYASAAAIVFDVSRVQTFESVQKWLTDLRDKVMLADGSPIPVVILANKTDIPGTHIPRDMLQRLCKEDNVIGWFSTSAKENINIDAAMEKLVVSAMSNRALTEPAAGESTDNITLHTPKRSKKDWRCCR